MFSSQQTDRQLASTLSTDRKVPASVNKVRFGIQYITEDEFDHVFSSFQTRKMEGQHAEVFGQVLTTVDIAHQKNKKKRLK